MRTTLEIDDQIMAAARSLARSRGISLGAAVSELARRGLMRSVTTQVDMHYSPFPVMAGDESVLVTDELIADLRDD
ncbi:hypothetical protein FNH13_02875 [Ornithinimicrobium ciconiae]|uniref:Antitoxin n=1 Tax=Ornithinimicrobium ciconiae TaxID=2594265 RepID=A0A516G797_9MICO|nr:hypothetical protein [Ornithinimicrobium ciconiae]QDO87406.1 hypothetical protein FNH13_02875 [Ornithinimicrobium ciconiae]